MSKPSIAFNIPNMLSYYRILVIPAMFALFYLEKGAPDWAAFAAWSNVFLFMLAGLSDFLDGKIARATGQTTLLGKFLDSSTDKMLIGATLMALVAFGIGRWPGRLDPRGALMLAGTLWLGGEFAFVVFSEAARVKLMDAQLRNQLTAIVGVSMALTPVLLLGLHRLLRLVQPKRRHHPVLPQRQRVGNGGLNAFHQQTAIILQQTNLRRHLHGYLTGQLQVVELFLEAVASVSYTKSITRTAMSSRYVVPCGSTLFY